MKKLFYILCCSLAVLFTACEGEEPKSPEDSKVPATSNKVETGASSNVTDSSATLKGVVNVDISAYKEIEFGIMYSTSSESISNRSGETEEGEKLIGKNFEVELSDLKSKTKYYYCAYLLLNEMQYEFGEMKEFITKSSAEDEEDNDAPVKPDDGSSSSSGVSKGHAYIDLGLSVKWATCNVGADSPEDYGDYFAWGETLPKSEYTWSTYKWYNYNQDYITKYCTYSEYGTVDNKTILELSDDAANANWGGSWRMPTKAEQDELRKKCTWTLEQKNGVNGYTVTGQNGNSIFLPTAGCRLYLDLAFAGTSGFYWSSSLYTGSSDHADFLGFFPGGVSDGCDSRHVGLSVRPVLP